MKIKILYFAMAKELRGASSEILKVPENAMSDTILDLIVHAHPALKKIAPTLRLAINETFIEAPTTLREHDVFAIIPPVTGG